jgi:peptidoglycan/xylan/chitin deacetylase (PgdA/CDA1 family)
VRAKLRAAGTALLLVAVLCAAAIAVDPEANVLGTPASGAAATFDLPAGPHQAGVHRAVIDTIIPAGRTSISVPIVLYHYIRDVSKSSGLLGYSLSTPVELFTQEMDWLAAHDYHTITMEDLSAYFTAKRPLPSKPVVLTFDDGYLDLYTTAYPILRQHGFKAVAYIVSGFVGEPRYVTAAMIQDMDAHGIEIASHTVNHPNLARTAPFLVTYEVTASKQWLETLLGQPVVDFAYPSGKYSPAVEDALAKAGYSTAVTEDASTYHSWADRLLWGRIRAYGGETLAGFILNLGPIEPYITVKPAIS